MNASNVAAAWASLASEVGHALKKIDTDMELDRFAATLDELLDKAASDHSHGPHLHGLIALISDLIEQYESSRFERSNAKPADVLRLLMESNQLTQADLSVDMGGQSVVSAVLNGHRAINARQAAALAARFGVSAGVFVEQSAPSKQPWKRAVTTGGGLHKKVGFTPRRSQGFVNPVLKPSLNSIISLRDQAISAGKPGMTLSFAE